MRFFCKSRGCHRQLKRKSVIIIIIIIIVSIIIIMVIFRCPYLFESTESDVYCMAS